MVWLPNIVIMLLPSLIIGAFSVMFKGKKYVSAMKNTSLVQKGSPELIVKPNDVVWVYELIFYALSLSG